MNKSSISPPKNGIALLEADMCDSTKLKSLSQNKFRDAKVVQLHNTIVKEQVEFQSKGKVLKEWGDAVIAFFDDIEDCLVAARRIQEAFNLYNLLFSAHQLHTKLSIVRFNHDPGIGPSLFNTTSSARDSKDKESLQIYDFLGTDIDRLARILDLAKPNEILISEEVLVYLNSKYNQNKNEIFKKLEENDPARRNFLRGVGQISLGELFWNCFPKNQHLAIKIEFPEEAVAAFNFEHIKECLGPINDRLSNCCPSSLKHLKLPDFNLQDELMDILLIGQSLKNWSELLVISGEQKKIQNNEVKLGVVIMSEEHAAKILKLTTPNSDWVIKNINESIENFKKVDIITDYINIRWSPTLIGDTWGFYTNSASDLFKHGRDISLPYEQIFTTYSTCHDGKIDHKKNILDTVHKITEKYQNNLPVEWCVHDVLLGVNPEEALSTLLSLDWIYALSIPRKSQYLLAREKCQYLFKNAHNLREKS